MSRNKPPENDYSKAMRKHVCTQQLRKAKKKAGINQPKKKPRQKNWAQESWEEWDDLNLEESEPVMPRGEKERLQRFAGTVVADCHGLLIVGMVIGGVGLPQRNEVNAVVDRGREVDRVVPTEFPNQVGESGFVNILVLHCPSSPPDIPRNHEKG